jgi:uncharacterized protein
MASKNFLVISIVGAVLALANSADTASASAVTAANPSFDCTRARTPTERQICQSPRLAELDNALADGYAFLKSTRGRTAADQIGIPHLKLISQCGADEDCIQQRQLDEIAALRAAGAPISLPAWAAKNGVATSEPTVTPSASKEQASASPYTALTGVMIRSDCHQNECQGFRIDQSTLVLSSVQKSMFEIKASNWSSDYPDGNYDKARPREASAGTTSYIVCSRNDPSIIDYDEDDGWTQAQLAPGDKDKFFGYLQSALVFYWAACHGKNVQDLDAAAVMAHKLGYPATVASDTLPQRSLAAPLDGFVDPVATGK